MSQHTSTESVGMLRGGSRMVKKTGPDQPVKLIELKIGQSNGPKKEQNCTINRNGKNQSTCGWTGFFSICKPFYGLFSPN